MSDTAAKAPQQQELSLRVLLQEMIQRGASDLHITVGNPAKLRIDGDLTNSRIGHVLAPKDTLSLAYSILTENQKKRYETEDELDFSFGVQNLSRFRGNVYKQRGCVAMAIRQIPYDIVSIDKLGLPPIISKLAERPRGLVLVTGPTGSGKSTTLYSCVHELAQDDVNLVTVEDPVEYRIEGVNQVPVNPKRGLTFAAALRARWRASPGLLRIWLRLPLGPWPGLVLWRTPARIAVSWFHRVLISRIRGKRVGIE